MFVNKENIIKRPVCHHDSVMFIVLIVAFDLSEGLKFLVPKDASSKIFMYIIKVKQILWQCVIYKESLLLSPKNKTNIHMDLILSRNESNICF